MEVRRAAFFVVVLYLWAFSALSGPAPREHRYYLLLATSLVEDGGYIQGGHKEIGTAAAAAAAAGSKKRKQAQKRRRGYRSIEEGGRGRQDSMCETRD